MKLISTLAVAATLVSTVASAQNFSDAAGIRSALASINSYEMAVTTPTSGDSQVRDDFSDFIAAAEAVVTIPSRENFDHNVFEAFRVVNTNGQLSIEGGVITVEQRTIGHPDQVAGKGNAFATASGTFSTAVDSYCHGPSGSLVHILGHVATLTQNSNAAVIADLQTSNASHVVAFNKDKLDNAAIDYNTALGLCNDIISDLNVINGHGADAAKAAAETLISIPFTVVSVSDDGSTYVVDTNGFSADTWANQ